MDILESLICVECVLENLRTKGFCLELERQVGKYIMNTDSVSDMLTRIRNGQLRGADNVEMPYSRLKEEIAKLIVESGFALGSRVFKNKDSKNKSLNISLKYNDLMEPAISKIERVSKSSLRKYSSAKDLKPVIGGLGVEVISTSRGVMTADQARKKHLGGEIICRFY